MITYRKHRRWILLLVLMVATVGYAELSVWTSVSGAELEARFVGIENEQVILQPEEGDEAVIRLNLLVPADQARARELQASRDPTDADTDDADDDDDGQARLPVLRDGPGEGQHAYYSHAHFDAWVRPNGRLYIHPKEEGERVGRAFFVRPRVIETVSGHPSARVYDFLDYQAPTANPRTVSFKVLARRDDKELTYQVEYTFDQNTICSTIEIVEPRRSDRSFRASHSFRFPRVENIPAAMPQTERVQLLEPHILRWRSTGGGGWQEENFYDARTLRGRVDDAEISGPWGERVVNFSGENRRSGNSTHFWNYRGRTLNDGYRINHGVRLGERGGECCITVE